MRHDPCRKIRSRDTPLADGPDAGLTSSKHLALSHNLWLFSCLIEDFSIESMLNEEAPDESGRCFRGRKSVTFSKGANWSSNTKCS